MRKCPYFGIRTDKIRKNHGCERCEKNNPKLYEQCTKETDTFLAISIDVDSKGNTIKLPPGEGNVGSLPKEKKVEKEKPKLKKKRRTRVTGVVKLARKLFKQGKDEDQVQSVLSEKYAAAGCDTEESLQRAKGIIYDVKRELGGDNGCI